MLYKHLFDGGIPYMLLIYILGVVVIALTLALVYGYIKKGPKDYEKLKKQREVILFLGSIGLLVGIIEQIIGITAIMNFLAEIEVSPAQLARGFRASLIAPAYGFILFLITYVIWFVARMVHR